MAILKRPKLGLDTFYGQKPADWTLNPFKPRFYYEWHYRTDLDATFRVIVKEYEQGWKTFIGLLKGLKKNDQTETDNNAALVTLQIAHVTGNWPILENSAEPTDEIQRSDFVRVQDKRSSLAVIPASSGTELTTFSKKNTEKAIEVLANLPALSNEKVNDVHDLVAKSALPAEWKRKEDLHEYLLDKVSDKNATPLPQPTLQEVYNAAPAYMQLQPWKPTPEHFSVVSLRQVVSEGFSLSHEELESKAQTLQLTIWLCMLFSASMVPFMFKFLAMILISIFLPEVSFWESLFQFVVTTSVFGFGLIGYVSYSHFFFEYCTDRFTSYKDHFEYIKAHPLALLPMARFIEKRI